MTATEFFNEYKSKVREHITHTDGRNYLDIYRTDEPTFTELINKQIIHSIIAEAGLDVQHEYFRIDTVGWHGKYDILDRDRAKTVGLNRHLWDLMIAVEHENDKEDWLDELIKLIHVKCPLKVVIGYNYCDCRGENENNKLQYAAECMQMIKAFSNDTAEEYLITIGNGAPKDKSKPNYTSFDYRAYLYNCDEKQFIRI